MPNQGRAGPVEALSLFYARIKPTGHEEKSMLTSLHAVCFLVFNKKNPVS